MIRSSHNKIQCNKFILLSDSTFFSLSLNLSASIVSVFRFMFIVSSLLDARFFCDGQNFCFDWIEYFHRFKRHRSILFSFIHLNIFKCFKPFQRKWEKFLVEIVNNSTFDFQCYKTKEKRKPFQQLFRCTTNLLTLLASNLHVAYNSTIINYFTSSKNK